MKAAVVRNFGDNLDVSEVECPTPGPNQLLVKLVTSGVCHTDLHAAQGDWPVRPEPPFIPGHEGVGVVEEVGEGVDDVKVGDMVGNAWLWSACGKCEYCRKGWETVCDSVVNGGYTANGSFSEYMVVDARYAPRIPEWVDPVEAAPILCAGVTVYKAIKETEAKPGQWIVISGIGGLGHIAVQYAVAMGLRVVAVDIADEKLELAKEHGAEAVVNAATEDPGEKVKEITGGGAHGIVVTAVHPKAFSQAIAMCRKLGTIVFVGLPPGATEVEIFWVVLLRLTIRGSIVGTRQDMEEALDFFARGKIKPTVATRKLDEINDIFDEMKKGAIDGRLVIDYR